MINSRRIQDLHPKVATMAMLFVEECRHEGIDLLVTSTYRDMESQAALFAQGRTTPGKIVTKARPGQSFHNYKVALDVVPLRFGKPVWNTSDPIWAEVVRIGKACGFEWAGDWKSFKEYAHFQYTGGLTLADFQKGITL
jgi:peptidoglycan L-alanyl-D-glutamate endopeptidase CwlK